MGAAVGGFQYTEKSRTGQGTQKDGNIGSQVVKCNIYIKIKIFFRQIQVKNIGQSDLSAYDIDTIYCGSDYKYKFRMSRSKSKNKFNECGN